MPTTNLSSQTHVPSSHGTYAASNSGGSASGPVPLATAITRPIANRTKSTFINTHLSDGINKFGVYRSRHRVFPGWDCTGGLRVWYANRSSEADGANAITVSGRIEVPAGSGNWTAFTFSAAGSVTIATNGADVACDALALTPAGGTYVNIESHVSVATAGQTWPMLDSISLAAANGEGYALSASADPGAPANADLAEFYGPVAITGLSKAPYVVGIFSDSIGNGAKDTLTGDKIGFLQRILGDTVPVINFSTSGDTLASFVTTNTKRLALADQMGLTHGVLAYGTNDTKSLVSLKTNYTTAIGLLQVRNLMVTACPIIGRTTSTNSWTAAADQTVVTDYGVAGLVDQFNTYLQGLVGNYVDNFVDTRTGWQDASNLVLTTGAAFGYTPDGLHPGPVGNAQIASGRAATDVIAYVTKTFNPSYAAWATTAGFFDAPNDTTAGVGVITTANNKVSGKGNIAQGSAVTVTTSRGPLPLFNAPAYVQTRSGTNDTSVLIANASDAISTMMRGTNIDYTVLMAFQQTTAAISFPFGWSETVDATNTRQACLVIRNGANASWRYGTTGDTNLDVNLNILLPNKMYVIAVRHTAGKTDVWINSLTKLISAATQAPAAAFGTGTCFGIGTSQLAGVTPAFNTNGFPGGTFAFVPQPSARSDAEINAGIAELARRFGVILT